MEIHIATPPIHLQQKAHMEGPTRKQAMNMAAYRQKLLAQEAAATAAGDDMTALERAEAAFDIECDLRTYGFDIDTGKPVKR